VAASARGGRRRGAEDNDQTTGVTHIKSVMERL
jgi:hypothetical protein